MNFPSPGDASKTLWVVVFDALMLQPAGLVFEMQHDVAFGLTLYTDGPTCPELIEVPSAVSNYDAIWDPYFNNPPPFTGNTPTGESVNAVIDRIVAERNANPNDHRPRYIVLATDGAPDTCVNPDDTAGGMTLSEQAAQRACDENITLYVLWVGAPDPNVQMHLQNIANNGVCNANPPAPYWEAGSEQGLRDALSTIMTNAVSCVVEMQGKVDPTAACSDPESDVRISDDPLTCGDPNGYQLLNENTIEFLGDACTRIQTDLNATVTAEFPCEVIILE
jgi:hypothetical protein